MIALVLLSRRVLELAVTIQLQQEIKELQHVAVHLLAVSTIFALQAHYVKVF